MLVEFDLDSHILQDALARVANVSVAVEQLDGSDTVPLRNLFWARGESLDEFEVALEDDDSVRRSTRLASTDGRRLYRVNYPEGVPDVEAYRATVELDGVLLSATSEGDGWTVRMRFPDRDSFSSFAETCSGRGLTVTPRAMYSQQFAPVDDVAGLTDAQRDALVTGAELGYFEIPRKASLDEVADALGVSPQAASERLRRGTQHLVDSSLRE